MLLTPVVFTVFNRPDTTAQVFAQIARARPRRLLVVADGPRPGRPGEAERCAAARGVVERVNWDCEVSTNYSDVNLGCGRRLATGITWAFEQVESAIVLEDDCVPHPTFFRFCDELLDRYRDDPRVMVIAGSQFGPLRTPFSYYFSRHYPSWGWASWRRAWRHFDLEMKMWPLLRDTPWLRDILEEDDVIEHWRGLFDRTHAGAENVDTWDYQWTFACWVQSGLSIVPGVPLVANIGYGADGTHTRRADDPLANVAAAEMAFPLRHPPYVVRDRAADQVFVEQVIRRAIRRKPGLYRRLCQTLARRMSRRHPGSVPEEARGTGSVGSP